MLFAAGSKTQKSFDYDSLDSSTALFVREQTGEIRALFQRTAVDMVETGRRLLAVKAKLQHGQFLDWLQIEFEVHRGTANRFMQVAREFGSLEMSQLATFDITALYQLATPSTPKAARDEAIARAKSGENITYTKAKKIKQNYTNDSIKIKKAKLEVTGTDKRIKPDSKDEQQLTTAITPSPVALAKNSTAISQTQPKPQIVAFIPRTQKQTTANPTEPMLSASQSTIIASVEQAGTWWQLDKRHLLYCGDPNSDNFIRKIQQHAPLLLAFPAETKWYPLVSAQTLYIMAEQVLEKNLKKKGWEHLDELLELMILDCSESEDLVVSCFLPLAASSIVLNLLNRLLRRGIMAEPDPQRCRSTLAAWKKAGGKVEEID